MMRRYWFRGAERQIEAHLVTASVTARSSTDHFIVKLTWFDQNVLGDTETYGRRR